MSVISIEIKDELRTQLETEAKAQDIDSQELIIKALNNYFRQKRIRSIQNELSSHFKERGYFSEDDILNEVS